MKQPSISLSDFQKAMAAAKRKLFLITKEYPMLRAYLVLVHQGVQIETDSSLQAMIKEFHEILVVGGIQSTVLDLLEEPLPEGSIKIEEKLKEERFQRLAKGLDFNGEIQFEVRFNYLDYGLVSKLQADALVDRKLTPQSKASIRIVLGTAYSLKNLPSMGK